VQLVLYIPLPRMPYSCWSLDGRASRSSRASRYCQSGLRHLTLLAPRTVQSNACANQWYLSLPSTSRSGPHRSALSNTAALVSADIVRDINQRGAALAVLYLAS